MALRLPTNIGVVYSEILKSYILQFMHDDLLQRILANYGLRDYRIDQPSSGYRNTSWPVHAPHRTYNLILYKNEQGIADVINRANTVGAWVAAGGIPARVCADTRILQISSHSSVRYCGLYEYLPGETIPWEAYTMRHLKLLGEAMSDMHAQVRERTIAGEPITKQLEQLLDTMADYFSQPGVVHAMRQKLGVNQLIIDTDGYRRLLHACERLPGQLPLHMDFVRGNVLFMGKASRLRISGILDFEKTSMGHPLFDIARTLAFLLVDCKYKPADKIAKYFVRSGYHKRGRHDYVSFTIDQRPVLDLLVTLFMIHDFYKLLLHNPYEYLHGNQHYVRTRDLLLDKAVIDAVHQ